MKAYRQIFTLVLIILFIPYGYGQADDIPSPPTHPRLVNDYTGFLTSKEQNYLERKLVAFDDSTSTQIAIVIVKSLNGYTPNDFATRLGQKWGVGHKENEKNNGIVVLVKPKTPEEKGQVYIATGYGMESFVTDALSKRIIENEILPAFRSGQNFQGLNKAVDVLMSLSKGQFTVDQYMARKKKKDADFPLAALIIIGILIVVFFFRGTGSGGSRHISSGGDLPFWLLMGSMMSSGRSRGGGFGDFSSGSGGFGGFGGGGFGGGGAGGSW